VEVICKTYKFCDDTAEPQFSGEVDLQKYAAKAYPFCKDFCTPDMPSQSTKIGYARVSTQDQNLDLQLRALKKAGCRKIFQEKASGASRARPEFQLLLDQLREGDVVVVWKLDRLARSTRDLLGAMEIIRDAGARFRSHEVTLEFAFRGKTPIHAPTTRSPRGGVSLATALCSRTRRALE
jgi:hypothetical protein